MALRLLRGSRRNSCGLAGGESSGRVQAAAVRLIYLIFLVLAMAGAASSREVRSP